MPRKNEQQLIIPQPTPIRKKVYEHLRDRILRHEFEPSSRLIEAQIAQEIGISRTPVREALHLLEKDGFLESIPRVGYRVRELDWQELEQIFEIRRVNETLACRWAVARIDAKTIKALDKNLQVSGQVLAKGDPNLFIACDEEFHEILGRASGSKHLFELCQQLRRLMQRYRNAGLRNLETVEAALADHARIVDCLKEKDAPGMEAALLAHLAFSQADLRNVALKQSGVSSS